MKTTKIEMSTVGSEPARTWQKDPTKTGLSNPKCYASTTYDCVGKLTLEHFISENILKQIPALAVSGMSWQEPGESTSLPPSAFGSNILCERHNNILSELDLRIGEFFGVIRELSTRANNQQALQDFRVHKAFWGWDLERWLLKTMIGIYYSGNMKDGNGNRIPKSGNVSAQIIDLLFSSCPWAGHLGLYNLATVGTRVANNGGVALSPIYNEENRNEIIGANFNISGFPLSLVLGRVSHAGHVLHHPKAFLFQNGHVVRRLTLLW